MKPKFQSQKKSTKQTKEAIEPGKITSSQINELDN